MTRLCVSTAAHGARRRHDGRARCGYTDRIRVRDFGKMCICLKHFIKQSADRARGEDETEGLTFSVQPGRRRSSNRHNTTPSFNAPCRNPSGSDTVFFGDSRTPSVMSHVTVCSAGFILALLDVTFQPCVFVMRRRVYVCVCVFSYGKWKPRLISQSPLNEAPSSSSIRGGAAKGLPG